MHTDITKINWSTYLPERFHPYIYLARLDRPIGIWLLALPGWWGIVLASGGVGGMGLREWYMAALFGVGAIVMRGAGCVVNDIWDRNLDAGVERTQARPLASGSLSVREALLFLAGLLWLGFAILIQMNMMTIMLGFLVLPLIALYPLMKRWTYWPQAFLGLTFNFGALMGWACVTDSIDFSAILLYGGGIFWTLGYDTIYAHQDKEDDALMGVKSTALKFGKHSRFFVSGFYLLFTIFIGISSVLASGKSFSLIFLVPAALHLAWQIKSWDIDDAQKCLHIFKSNKLTGLLVLAGLSLGTF